MSFLIETETELDIQLDHEPKLIPVIVSHILYLYNFSPNITLSYMQSL